MRLIDKDNKKSNGIKQSYITTLSIFLLLIILVAGYSISSSKQAEVERGTTVAPKEVKNTDVELFARLIKSESAPASVLLSVDIVTNAIKRYQTKAGIISANVKHGDVGPITRAGLHSDFSSHRGRVAVVEGEYDSVLLLEDEEFSKPTVIYHDFDNGVVVETNIWVKPQTLTEYESFLLGNNAGYGVGLKENGKIYARTPYGDVTTKNQYINEGGWQHITVLVSDEEIIFIHDNESIEIVERNRSVSYSQAASLQEAGSFIVRTMSGVLSTFITSVLQPIVSPNIDGEGDESGGLFSFLSDVFEEYQVTEEEYETKAEFTVLPSIEEDEPFYIEPFKELFTIEIPEIIIEEDKAASVEIKEDETDFATSTPKTTEDIELSVETASGTLESDIATSTTEDDSVETITYVSLGGGGSSPEPVNEAPVITLNGSESVEIEFGTVYIDSGAVAIDEEDGDITENIVVGGDTVDYMTPGDYLITYNVDDLDGEPATEIARIVVVNELVVTEDSQEPDGYSLAAAAGESVTYKVSSGGGEGPDLVEVNIDPLHVFVGDTQTMTVKLTSDNEITSVQSFTELDTTTLTLDFEEVSSDETGVTYSTSWVVNDTHTKVYRTTFTATDNLGQSNSTEMAWSDPCTGITDGQDSTLSQTSCAISGVNGLDGGSLTIPSGKSITLNSGATWVWNPGTSIIVNGTINISKTGGTSLRKGYLFYSGTDYDGANTVTRVFGSEPTLSNHVRVEWYEQTTPNSCSLSASPTSLIQGAASTLTFSSTGDRSSFSINQSVGTKSINGGTTSVSPSSTKTYTGTVIGDGGTNTCAASVTVYTPTSCSLSFSPTSIVSGNSSTLTYSSAGSRSSFSINQGVGSKSTSGGTVSVSPTTSTTYTGTVNGNGGLNTCQKTLTVTQPTPTCAMSYSPIPVFEGGSVTLSWTSTNATSFSINQGIGSKPTSGSHALGSQPISSITYTGTIVGAGGSDTCNVTVTVGADPCSSGCGK